MAQAASFDWTLPGIRHGIWRLIVSTVAICMRNRVTGLAAEAAFFALLSLPPLIFALAGSIGYVFAQFSDTRIEEVRAKVLEDRKSTRLNSSHPSISYAVFC